MHSFTSTLRAGLMIAATMTFTACGGSHDHEGDGGGGGDTEDAEHAHDAPNGGTLLELEDHAAYVEFLVDAEAGTMTMFTLGGHADKALRTATESVVIKVDTHGDSTFDVTLAAQANKLSKETVGDSSKFMGQSDSLKGVEHFHGVIQALTLKDSDYLNFKFDFPGEHDEDGEEHGDEHDGEGEDHDGDHDHDDDDSEHDNG